MNVTIANIDTPDDTRLDQFRNVKGQNRRNDGTFVAESELVLERLFASGITVRAILLTPARADRLASSLTEHCVDHDGVQTVDVFAADQPIIDLVVGYALHRGVISVAERPVARSAAGILETARTIVVLEEVMDPDNVGSVFRHCAGFGVDAIVLCGSTGDPLYRKTIRTSMGWTLQTPYAQVDRTDDLLRLLRAHGFVTLALTPSPSADTVSSVLNEYQPAAKMAFLLGAEGPGLKPETLEEADHRVRIPLAAGVDSLNVATATAIALYALIHAHPERLASGRADASGPERKGGGL